MLASFRIASQLRHIDITIKTEKQNKTEIEKSFVQSNRTDTHTHTSQPFIQSRQNK